MNPLKSAWAHAQNGDFGAFPTFFVTKGNSSISRGLGQSSFVRGCDVGMSNVRPV